MTIRTQLNANIWIFLVLLLFFFVFFFVFSLFKKKKKNYLMRVGVFYFILFFGFCPV